MTGPASGAVSLPQPPAAPAGARRRRGASADRVTGSVYLVYFAWVVVLFDPHYFLAAFAGSGAGKIATLMYMSLLGLLLLRIPRNIAEGRLWVLYPAYLLWVGSGLLSLPVTPNVGLVRDCLRILLLYWAVGVATPDIIRTPKLALPLVAMFGLRFAWWEFWAGGAGLVFWHPSMANYDGYGALAAQGAGICYWMGTGARVPWQRKLYFALAAVAVLGVVSTAARGAFLALVLAIAVIWLRSPRKGATALAVIGASVVTVLAATLLFDGSAFWTEIMSSFEEGTSEGTGQQRWELWTAATRVWKEHWLAGVGAGNFGVYAASFFEPGEFSLFPNPSMFYGYNLHNAYMQVLAEWGVLGMSAFLWLHVDFFLKNRALRTPEAEAQWVAGGGDRVYKLSAVSLALEAGFLALMLTNMVYANLFEAWLIMFWALNRALWGATRSTPRRVSKRKPRRTPPGVALARPHTGRPEPAPEPL